MLVHLNLWIDIVTKTQINTSNPIDVSIFNCYSIKIKRDYVNNLFLSII
jgi:hypothetical protein